MIDWPTVTSTGRRLSPSGPHVSDAEAAEVIAELREAAVRAADPVEEFTGLAPTVATDVFVVDRPTWIEANAESFASLLGPHLTEGSAISRKVSGAQLGAMLGWLSGRVLGQFDPFTGHGRLLLVAPNVLKIETELGVDPSDFRLWVCLHEQTHRFQFTGVDWMTGHMKSLISDFMATTKNESTGLMTEALPELVKIAQGKSDKTLTDLFNDEQQRELVSRLTGLMSLLEGHADVVMDDVGPEVIRSVKQIRRKFNERRGSGNAVQKVVRRLLGFEAKMRQYRDGAVFVRTVMDTVGHEGFSTVWAAPENLPTIDEINNPSAWIGRVHG